MPPQTARPITSRQNPMVARFRRAARTPEQEVLVEGATLIGEAIRAGWTVAVAAFTRAAIDAAPRLWQDLSRAADCVEVTEPVLAAMSPARTPSGAVALAVPTTMVLDQLAGGRTTLAVATIGVQDPGNLGAIIRSAEALGASAVIAGDGSADPFGWKALRGAMGSAFRLPVVRHASVDDTLAWAAAHRIATLGLTLDGTPLASIDLREPALVLVGAEGHGLPSSVTARVERTVTIPMQPPVESLNVAVAAALLLYEARRQRRGQ